MFEVDDKVTVINKESYHFGKSGTVTTKDSSSVPYSVDFGDGYKDWCKESSLQLANVFKYGERVIQGNNIGIYIAQHSPDTHFVLFEYSNPITGISNTTIDFVNNLNIGSVYATCLLQIAKTRSIKLYTEHKITKMSVTEIEKVLQQCGKLVGSLEIVK